MSKKILSFKLYKRGLIYVVASKIVAFCAFGENCRVYLEGGTYIDVENSLEEIRKGLERATDV